MMKFNEITLPESILKSLEKIGYDSLTPIQEQIMPSIIDGKDVLGCSQTGSGKTGAFLIPVLAKLIENKNRKAIIVAPTRELATQIMDNAKIYADKEKSINKALIIGGASIRDQLIAIKKGVRLIVGTPGRINDFLDSGKLIISDYDILVLDEMDRMLDMGFSVQIDEIIKKIAKVRQTMLFSATISKKIEKLTERYLKNPIVVKVGDTNQASVNVSQEIIEVENDKKFEVLLEKLRGNTTFTLVFVKTKFGTERLATKLEKEGVMAKAIHGDLKQSKRAKIIQDFRDKKFNVLVATDVAARGLDIHHIDTVINYDLPQSPEDYIHRIGRCSRGIEIKGTSISFCSRSEKKLLVAIRSLMKDGEYEENSAFNNNDRQPRRRSSSNGGGNRRGSSRPGTENRKSPRREYNHKDRDENRGNREDKSETEDSGNREDRGNRGNREDRGNREYRGNDRGNREYKGRDSRRAPDREESRHTNRDNPVKNKIDKIDTQLSEKPRGRTRTFNREQPKNEKNGYDIEGLMNSKAKNMKIKRPSAYTVAKTSAGDRRKRLGLDR